MEEAYLYILNELGLQYRETVVLGVSGGPDSMALLDLFVRVAKTLDLKVICAHVNQKVPMRRNLWRITVYFIM